jgi:hypothetical protein
MSAFSRNLLAALAGHRKTLLAKLKARVRQYTADPTAENKALVAKAARSLARYQSANGDELPALEAEADDAINSCLDFLAKGMTADGLISRVLSFCCREENE